MNWDELVEYSSRYHDAEPQAYSAPATGVYFDGDKFAGGFGDTKVFQTDYWTLRKRSEQIFKENLYARGIIRRMITNEISTGLSPEASPEESIIGVPDDSLSDWTEDVENRIALWGKNPDQCDFKQESTFGALQRAARMEALIAGDALIVLRQNALTNLPMVQIISGSKIKTPLSPQEIPKNNTITHGVEQDARGRTVAYWVEQDDTRDFKRILARGARSGRKIAWLIYGTEKRLDDVRGEPLLSLVLQSLKEIDRYRDSAQRKAVVNSIVAMYIKKGEDKPSTRPITSGAVRRGKVATEDNDGSPRQFNVTKQLPGLVPEELQVGEEPVLLGGQGTDVNFGTFEEAIIQAVAWCLEIPPEVMRLTFSNNYSASQAAINEYKMAINRVWGDFGETFCQPIYTDWLLSEVLRGRIQADGLLDAWRDPQRQDVFGAWVSADWYGSIKPSTDMKKQGQGSKILIAEGWSNNAREARTLTGTKYSKNMKRLKRENELKAEAMRPLAEFEREFGAPATTASAAAYETALDDD